MDVIETPERCALATKESQINMSLGITFHNVCYTAEKGNYFPRNVLHNVCWQYIMILKMWVRIHHI